MFIKDILIRQKDNCKIAAEFGNVAVSYEDIYREVEKHRLNLHNITKEMNNIGIFLPNSTEYIIAYFTISFLDKVIIPIEIALKEEQINSTIQYCELRLIITNSEYKIKLMSLLEGITYKIAIYSLDDKSYEVVGNNDFLVLTDEMKLKITEDDVAIMLHTSGTTSNPKKVMLTHKNLISNIKSNIESLQLTSMDICLIVLPMFFGYCNTSQFLTHFYLGGTIIINDTSFYPKKFLQLIGEKKCTNTTCVPSMLILIMNYKKTSDHNLETLRYLCFGGGRMSVEKLKELMDYFPHTGIVQTYGQTEASPRITCLLPEDSIRKIGSVGKTIPGVSLKIVNENEEEVAAGEIGEIKVKGDNIMKGYYKRPDATSKIKKDGWLYTGDLATYDQEGYIYLKGRKKNVIISGGLNIYPEEIEELLINHPKIKEAIVISEEHQLLSEVPIAKVVIDKEGTISQHEIIRYCAEKLEGHKVPVKVIFVESMDKTSTGKIRRV